MNARRAVRALSWLVLATGTLLVTHELYMAAKARLAAHLLHRAFEQRLLDAQPHRPWRWADMIPIAELSIPSQRQTRVVLDGAAGSALAFGLGRVNGSAPIDAPGHIVLAAHRDSWGDFLETVVVGERLRLRTLSGERDYQVTRIDVVDKRHGERMARAEGDRLTLVTCYPFSNPLPSSLRLVVTAEPIGPINGPRAPRRSAHDNSVHLPGRAGGSACRHA